METFPFLGIYRFSFVLNACLQYLFIASRVFLDKSLMVTASLHIFKQAWMADQWNFVFLVGFGIDQWQLILLAKAELHEGGLIRAWNGEVTGKLFCENCLDMALFTFTTYFEDTTLYWRYLLRIATLLCLSSLQNGLVTSSVESTTWGKFYFINFEKFLLNIVSKISQFNSWIQHITFH